MAAKKQAPLIGERTNAELVAELKRLAAERDEALARERALAEVLHVINSSRGDLAPVFDGLLDRALRLCRAPFGVLFRYDGGRCISPRCAAASSTKQHWSGSECGSRNRTARSDGS